MIERGREANLAAEARRDSEGSRRDSSEQFRETRSDLSQEEQDAEEDLTTDLGPGEADTAYALLLDEELNRRTPARPSRKASVPATSRSSATPAPPASRITPPESSEGKRPSKKRKASDPTYQTPSRAPKRPVKTTRSAKYPMVRRPDGTMTIMTMESPPKPASLPPPHTNALPTSMAGGPASGLLTLPNPAHLGFSQHQTSAPFATGMQAPMTSHQGMMSDFGHRNPFGPPPSGQSHSTYGGGSGAARYNQGLYNEQPSRQRAPYNVQPSLTPTAIDPKAQCRNDRRNLADFIDPVFWAPQSHDQTQHHHQFGYQAPQVNQQAQENEAHRLPETQGQQGEQRRQPRRYGQ